MATQQPLWIYDGNGPKADATPVFVVYADKAGAPRALPGGLFFNLGGGQYRFDPTNDDEAVGTCALIDCGAGCQPRYQLCAIHGDDNPFTIVVPLDGNGDLSAGAYTIGSYLEISTGQTRTAPLVVKAGALEVYSLTPSEDDISVGTAVRLDAPAGVFPPNVNDSYQSSTAPDGIPATGGIEDLCDVVDLLASGTYVVRRRSPPAFVGGRKIPPTESAFSITASIQPASGQVVLRLPEGKRNREAMTVFCCVQLKTGELGQEPDLVAIDGGSFEVESVKRWAALGNYYEAIVTRRPGT